MTHNYQMIINQTSRTYTANGTPEVGRELRQLSVVIYSVSFQENA